MSQVRFLSTAPLNIMDNALIARAAVSNLMEIQEMLSNLNNTPRDEILVILRKAWAKFPDATINRKPFPDTIDNEGLAYYKFAEEIFRRFIHVMYQHDISLEELTAHSSDG